MRRKKKKKSYKKVEILNFFYFIASLFFLFSFLSFSPGHIEQNWLGIIGYLMGFCCFYLFGIASYLLPIFFLWLGIESVLQKKASIQWKSFCFSIMLISVSMLLTVFASMHNNTSMYLSTHIFSEKYFDPATKHIVFQYFLGGKPFHFLFQDLPYFNLQNLLSTSGNIFLFSISAFVSLILLTETHIFVFFQKLFRNIYLICKKISRMIYQLIQLSKQQKQKRKEPVSFPIKKTRLQPSIIPQKKIPSQPSISIKKKLPIFPKQALPNAISSKNLSYFIPSFSLLSNPKPIDHPSLIKELKNQAMILEETLRNFNIDAKVGEIHCGPTITLFEVHPSIGVKVQRIKAIESDIALNLQAKSIRIIAPIPGKAAVGVEVPSLYPQEVSFKEMLFHYKEQKKKYIIPMLLGKTVTGDYVITDLTKMPHCLIAGATGSGKSVCINTIVMSILMNAHPDEVKLLMIDPKKVELTQYSNLPHMIAPVITEAHGAYAALQWLVKEMQTRYDILKHLSLRNITAFNHRKIRPKLEAEYPDSIPGKMPLIIMVIDEFADLMMVSSADLETPIARIAQMARAVGIHLILATQRPSREVITGIIKANFPSRIAFKVASRINSQIILDETGAESLLGNGDLLFLPPGSSHLVRAQGAYISDDDINKVIDTICEKNTTSYLIPSFDALKKLDANGMDPKDELYEKALDIVLLTKNASTTFLQRKLKIGYARAASLMDELEDNGIIGPQIGSKPRQILVSSKEEI